METQSQSRSVNFSFRIDPALLERFELVADAERRSMSGELRRLIENRVGEFDAKVKEAA